MEFSNIFSNTSVKRDKLPLQIVNSIRELVLTGQLQPGDKLPNEQELTKLYSVSRQTMREVLRVLEMQGLLHIRPGAGGGIFISEVGLEVTRESLINFLHQTDLSLRHISQVRRLLDPYFAANAAQKADEEIIKKLEASVAEQEKFFNMGDLEATRKAEINFHRELAKVSDNPLLVLLEDFIETLLENIKKDAKPGKEFSKHSLEHHKKIVAAIKNHNVEEAKAMIMNDVDMVERDLFLLGAKKDSIKWTN